MPSLSYGEMDKLTPCRVCGSRPYWFDGQVWQCWNCVPPGDARGGKSSHESAQPDSVGQGRPETGFDCSGMVAYL